MTEAELEQMRAEATARGIKSFRYRGAERDWTPEQVAEAEAAGKPYTVRLKTPLDGATSFSDLIRGGDQITVNNSELQDIVLVKSSGMPLYHLAHLIDDHEMHITHVLRAEEWVPSAPYHVLLYQAFGWDAAGVRACAGDPAPGWQGQALQAQGRRRRPTASGSAATWPRRCSTTWRCRAGATTITPRS